MTTNGTYSPARAAAALVALTLILSGLGWAVSAPAQGATPSFDLWAETGTTTMPGGQTVPIWGYTETDTAATAPGGPTLTVGVNDTVTITLHNEVGEATGLLVQGQPMVPDLVGIDDGTAHAYTFTATRPGTFLYEAAPIPGAEHQPAMGLYGALVVLPTTAGAAYEDPSTAFDADDVLLLGEIDPALNGMANPAAFDMRDFAPRFFTINGQAYPDTAPITGTPGATHLLRFVNAGLNHRSMGVLGAEQTVIALDGAALSDARHYVAETVGPGQTLDSLIAIPAAAAVDTDVLVYDAGLRLRNGDDPGFGGQLTSIQVPGTPSPTDDVGPVVSGAALNGGTLTAYVDDGAGHGGSNITAAEFYRDDITAAPVTMAATDAAFDSSGEDVTAVESVPDGEHVYYLRGQDAAGNWGPLTSVLVTGADAGGPATTQPNLTPNRVNGTGTGSVAVTATGDDSDSGGSVIADAEYFIDAPGADGSGTHLSVTPSDVVASLDGFIGPGILGALDEGAHPVSIHAMDGQNNWGEFATVNLIVDKHGPLTSGVTAEPTPNNGTRRYNSSIAAVRLIATTMSDPIMGGVNSPIARAEAFIDTVGANGSGIGLSASDGVFSDTTEGGYIDIPLATVRQMTNGVHTLYVHAKDTAGNWGPTSSTTLLVDKIRPTAGNVLVDPNPTDGAETVALTATGTDQETAITAAEWWVGPNPGLGKGNPMQVTGAGPSYDLSATVPASALAPGDNTIWVRARDEAGNWSKAVTTQVQLNARMMFSTAGNRNPPGVAGVSDDSDVYRGYGAAQSRSLDLSAAPYRVPNGANVDAFDRGAGSRFYVSFSRTTRLPGLGKVQDEDVVLWNGKDWKVWFDGTAHGLRPGALDIDALAISGKKLFFSTTGNRRPPGVGGTGDDSDIYSWNGRSFRRVYDASAHGIAPSADVDGYDRVNARHFFLSFAADTNLGDLGRVADEDVVYSNRNLWTTYYDGSAYGLLAGKLDVDAIDVF
ncbi:multicopper oxidase domain-containing protein [Nocardioides sp.]|uniref:multicopper oxidase domain-containing protein n=1 Tax=Nocardioides sp. TaxID=35761 RepID=UPI003561D376